MFDRTQLQKIFRLPRKWNKELDTLIEGVETSVSETLPNEEINNTMSIQTGHKFGTISHRNLDTCHRDLKVIHEIAIERCPIDYGINQGHRSYEDQLKYFLEGKSGIDPRTGKKSKHMEYPAEATDIHVAEKHLDKALTWDKIHLAFIAGYLIALSHQLYENNKISHVLRWGGNWDSDGVIQFDQNLQDFPHLELIKP